ncbi:MAG: hypothetical protein IT209_06905 [Armatimonadetes bacterium]|nr:hypothetical protein [Armatimonadota bacterium]
MKLEYVVPFLQAGVDSLEKITGETPQRGALSLRRATVTSQQVTLTLDVSGALTGVALYGMSTVSATRIAGSLLGQQLHRMDAVASGALGEFGKTLSTQATEAFANASIEATVTAGETLRGVRVPTGGCRAFLVIPLLSAYGKVELCVSLSLASPAETETLLEKAA